jgi:hypothetical protein
MMFQRKLSRAWETTAFFWLQLSVPLPQFFGFYSHTRVERFDFYVDVVLDKASLIERFFF